MIKLAKKVKKWKKVPMEDEILLSLLTKENRGEMLTSDLYRKLKLIYRDLSYADLMSILFKLEVRSFIHVIPIKKTVYKIEINRNARLSPFIMKKVKNYMH